MSQSGKNNATSVEPRGFHLPHGSPSLPEVYQTIEVPHSLGFWRKMLAFAGPGYMVAVGYMDPGNWATDLAAGARFNYTLLSVIMVSNLMAMPPAFRRTSEYFSRRSRWSGTFMGKCRYATER